MRKTIVKGKKKKKHFFRDAKCRVNEKKRASTYFALSELGRFDARDDMH